MSNTVASDPDRLRKVFQRLDAAEDPSGQEVAFHIADKALKSAGISWADLLETHLNKSAPRQITDGDAFASMFEGIFSSFTTQQAKPAAKPAPTRPRETLQGEEIPDVILGRIVCIDDRDLGDGRRMLVASVEGFDTSYGPVALFNSSEIERWEQNKDVCFRARVRQPQSKRLMPILYGLRAA